MQITLHHSQLIPTPPSTSAETLTAPSAALPSPFPDTTAASNTDPLSTVLTKDFPISQSNNTWLRLFVPRQALDHAPTKLPLIVYYHGGGFIMLSAASTMLHSYCTTVAAGIPAVIASVRYRLAPEHRLPAAYEDAVEALHWIKSTKEELFTNHVDFSNCFLMGESAGANIAYHAGLRAAAAEIDLLLPMKIKRLILYHPFFGGTERTQSEIRLADDKMLPPWATDIMWELGLPAGVDRDHEYCNPTVNGGSDLCGEIRELGWKVLVTGCDGDPLIDRQEDFCEDVREKRGASGEQVCERGISWCRSGTLVGLFKKNKTPVQPNQPGQPDRIEPKPIALG